MPDWFDPKDEEQELAKAEQLFTTYPKHVLAFTLAKLLQQRLVHPELVQVNLERSDTIPLPLFIEAMKERAITDGTDCTDEKDKKAKNDRNKTNLKS